MTEAGPRQSVAVLLGRLAYVVFYFAVAALVLGAPLGLGYLLWRWLAG